MYIFIHLVRVDLNIILLVVSDSDDSAQGWKSLIENVGDELHEFLVHSEHRGLVRQIVTKISISSGDNLVSTTVNALAQSCHK